MKQPLSVVLPPTRTAIVIPAFNEELMVARVVESVLSLGDPIVVDDCSTDATSERAEAAGAQVATHARNRGYCDSVSTGLGLAISMDYDFAITIDGDGQHRSDAVVDVLNALINGADHVVGVRDERGRIGESLFAWVSDTLWGIADPLCGVKGYRLSKFASLTSLNTYASVATELTIVAARNRWKISQVPIRIQPRVGPSRFGQGVNANLRILSALVCGLLFQPGQGPISLRR